MKFFSTVALVLGFLSAGCSSHEDPQPAASLVGGVWAIESNTYVTTPKAGGPSQTTRAPINVGETTMSFDSSGKVLYVTRNFQTRPGVLSGTYTYSGNSLALSLPLGYILSRTVTELTDHRLVTTWEEEDATNQYRLTDTFTR